MDNHLSVCKRQAIFGALHELFFMAEQIKPMTSLSAKQWGTPSKQSSITDATSQLPFS